MLSIGLLLSKDPKEEPRDGRPLEPLLKEEAPGGKLKTGPPIELDNENPGGGEVPRIGALLGLLLLFVLFGSTCPTSVGEK